MKLYSVFDNDQWVTDMAADDIAEMIGCTREQVIRAVANASVMKHLKLSKMKKKSRMQ